MMFYLTRGIVTAILALILLLNVTEQARAIDPPDSMVIRSVEAFQDTIEADDMVIVFHYNSVFDDYPDEPAEDTIILRLYDPTGTIVLANAVPFTYFNNGYGNGAASFYFDSATAPAWGEAYIINIVGSPVFFDPQPAPYNYPLNISDYSVVDGQDENQELLADYIISISNLMQLAFGDVTLHGSTEGAVVLSDIGDAYFTGAVPGIHSMAPSLFLVQFFVPTPVFVDTSMEQAEEYSGVLVGTDVMRGFAAIGDEIGIPGAAVAGGLAFILFIAATVFTERKGWGAAPGMIAGGLVLTMASLLLGNAIMTISVIIALISGILIMYLIFFRRS